MIKNRMSIITLARCQIDVKDGAFLAITAQGERTHVPVGSLTCILLEPGTRISHAAMGLAGETGTLLIWIGEGGVRLYSSGRPYGRQSENLLYQAQLALDETARLKVVRKMFSMRFGEEAPAKRSIKQLRGMEGARVKQQYQTLAKEHGVIWKRRHYEVDDWATADVPNRCLSVANHCLYGLCEAAILAAGYAPAIGFLHVNDNSAFTYDIADVFKLEVVAPIAFRVAKQNPTNLESTVRLACRDRFRKTKFLEHIIPKIEEILAAGELDKPKPPADGIGPAIPKNPEEDV